MDIKSKNIGEELNRILDFLKNHEDGKSIEALQSAFKSGIDRRTLQRRMRHLVIQGKVLPVGKGRATKYALAKTIEARDVAQETDLLPLSKEGKAIQYAISLPLQQRHPVGYNRAFLESYLPNTTSYLTPKKRTG